MRTVTEVIRDPDPQTWGQTGGLGRGGFVVPDPEWARRHMCDEKVRDRVRRPSEGAHSTVEDES